MLAYMQGVSATVPMLMMLQVMHMQRTAHNLVQGMTYKLVVVQATPM